MLIIKFYFSLSASSFSSLNLIILFLIYSQFLHQSTCSASKLDDQILESKIKAIASVELSSMSFNELPSLFFLYENLVNKRFESVHKKDRSKFEEFKKVHQYNAIKSSFGSLKEVRDALTTEMFNAENLEIINKKINWSESDATKYGFLSAVPEKIRKTWGDFKFKEPALADFFIAQYFYDNIVQPKGEVSDDEMELRIRFFIHIMNYKFKYLLDRISPQDLNHLKRLSKIFSKDKEILSNLWGINDSHPYFLRFFKFPNSNDDVYDLKEIAENFFKIEADTNLNSNSTKLQAENIFRGKNQVLNVLYRIREKNDEIFTKAILEVTKYEVSDETLTKLNQTENFLDFVDTPSFTVPEIREFYLANSFNLIRDAENGTDLLVIWRKIHKYFNINEHMNILTAKDIAHNYTHLFSLPSHDDQSYVETFFNLTKFYFKKDKIKEFLVQRAPINHKSFITEYISIAHDVKIFEINYNFAKAYLDHEQLKNLLFDNDPVPFVFKVAENCEIFKFCMNIMTEFYTEDEIRALLMQTDENNANVLFRAVLSRDHMGYRPVADYFKDIFKGHEDMLRTLFRTRTDLGETVLGFYNRSHHQKQIKPFLDLAKELFTKEEIEELQKRQDN